MFCDLGVGGPCSRKNAGRVECLLNFGFVSNSPFLWFVVILWRFCKIAWNYILIHIQQDVTLHSLSGNCSTYFGVVPPPITRSANNCIYSIWYLSHLYCYLPLSWKRWNWFECVMGGVRHPQHTQTSSNSSMIAAGSSNGVTNTRCCRYSCLRSWWWVVVPPRNM